MSQSVKRLIAEAPPMDFGDMPPSMDPAKRRKIERGEHPYATNPAFPDNREGGNSYAELAASEDYARIVNKIASSAGLNRAQLRQLLGNPHAISGIVMTSMRQAMQFEAGHEEELEQAAVNLVLDLPEFATAKEAYAEGDLRIVAKLVKEPVSTDDMRAEPEVSDEEIEQSEMQVAEIADEINAEVNKRRAINLMIQGAAINKNHAYHLIGDALDRINPQLLKTYGLLMSTAEYMYWAIPEEMHAMMGGAAGGAAGKAHFEIEEGVPTIKATAVVFPVLIQELVKGLMEFLSYDEDEPDDIRRHVQGKVDTLGNEAWDIMMGPAMWRRVAASVPTADQRYLPHVYTELRKLSPNQFSAILKGIVSGTPQGRDFVRRTIADAKSMEESSSRIVDNLLG